MRVNRVVEALQTFAIIARVADRRAALFRRMNKQLSRVRRAARTAAMSQNTRRLVTLTDELKRIEDSNNRLQKRATDALVATDTLTYAAAVIGLGTLGVNIAEGFPQPTPESFPAWAIPWTPPWATREILGAVGGMILDAVFALVHNLFLSKRRIDRDVHDRPPGSSEG